MSQNGPGLSFTAGQTFPLTSDVTIWRVLVLNAQVSVDTSADMERAYETSHGWPRFSLDLRRAAPRLWVLLGEAASKCEHIAAVPLEPATAERLHRLYLAKGALATTAIEGNTLTEQEVLAHLEGKLQLPKSKEYVAQEIDNIVRPCNELPTAAAGHRGPLPWRSG